MKRKLLCLIMMTLMILGTTLTTHAEDYVGSTQWTIDFDGRNMNSNFESAAMTQDILNILPGDSITLQVNIKNTDYRRSDWYMTNEVVQSLEESSAAATGGAYTYVLTYVAPDGEETTLFTSERIGGDDSVVGLSQATAGLEDYFYLDRLDTDEQAKIILYVQLDGETQGNDYQDTLAKLRMNFAVERVYEDVITETIKETKLVTLSNVVKTGDNSPIVLFSGLALACGVALLVVAVVAMKRKNSERGE